MTDKKRGIGIALSYVNTFTNMICGIFLSAYILRIVGDTEYGVYQTISSFANYLVLLEFGTGTAMTRNLSVCRGKNESDDVIQKNIGTIWTITVVLAAVISAVSVIFCMNIKHIYAKSMTPEQIGYAEKIFVFITVFLLGSFFLQTINGAILANEKYVFSSMFTLIRTVTRTVLLVSLLRFWRFSIVIAIVDMALTLIILIISFLYCRYGLRIRFRIRDFDKSVFKSTIGLCLAVFLQVIINQSNNNVDKFLIGIKVNPEAVTMYSVGMYVYSIFSSLTTIPIAMYAPEIAKNISAGLHGEKLVKTLVPPSRLIVLVGGSVLFGFIAVGKQFITMVYGAAYVEAYRIAIIIMIPMFINMSNGVLVNVLDVLNKRMSRSLILLATTALNIVLTVFFLDWYGIIGAAAATCIATMLGQVILMNIYYKTKIGIDVIHMFAMTYKGIVLYQALGALIAFTIAHFITNPFVSFFAGGIVYCIISFGLFWFFGADAEEKKRLKKLIERGKYAAG